MNKINSYMRTGITYYNNIGRHAPTYLLCNAYTNAAMFIRLKMTRKIKRT